MNLQKEVWEWAVETFGYNEDIDIAIRGNKEMAELLSTIKNRPDASNDIIEECADVAFFLLQICEFHKGDLMKAVADKLEINRKRVWEKSNDGSFQHVKGT
jgi:NTP pyrophosphatase (non-canonical NTP hydrolase)